MALRGYRRRRGWRWWRLRGRLREGIGD